MSDTAKQAFIFPTFIILALVSAVTWLVQGSSHQAKQSNWLATWQAGPSFHYPRRAPAAVASNGYLYVVGGIDGNNQYVHTVEYAPLSQDGTVGKWQTTSALNEGRFYNAAVAAHGFLYAIGGGSGAPGEDNYPIASVERAKINTDGSLSAWEVVSHLLTPRRGLKTVLHNNTIYAIGGYDGRFLKSTEFATIKPDGTLTPWEISQHDSIIDRYIHSATIHGGRIYLLGGHMRDPNKTSYGDVEHAEINSDGELKSWQIEPNHLLVSRLVAEAFVLNDYLYIAGGHNGNQRLNTIEVTKINHHGRITPWRLTTSLPIPLSAYTIATYNKHVYALGGAGDEGPLNSIFYATANFKGELGVTHQHQ